MMHRLVLSVTLTAALLGPAPAGLFDRLWAAFSFLGASASPKAGCELDPYGRCLPSQPRTEAGCELDPNGSPKCS